jgi:hypothetical protein
MAIETETKNLSREYRGRFLHIINTVNKNNKKESLQCMSTAGVSL